MNAITEVAKKIATALNEAGAYLGVGQLEWHIAPDFDEDWRATILGPQGASIFISNTWAGKGRLYLSGNYPQDIYIAPEERKSITFAETTSLTRVVSGIRTRLLPSYLATLAIKIRQKQEADAYQAGKKATYAKALAILGIPERSPSGHQNTESQYHYFGPSTAKIEALNPAQIEINHLQLTTAQLERLKAAVPELFERS